MPQRPCLGTPARACGRLTTRPDSRCTDCASAMSQARDARRGSRHARGLGADHDAIRAALLRAFVPGTLCPRCNRPMLTGQALDAGHPIGSPRRLDRTSKADHLEHATCNRGASD